jgi:PKD repeat protein
MTDLNLGASVSSAYGSDVGGPWRLTVTSASNANDGNVTTYAFRGIHTGAGSSTVSLGLVSDLGASYLVGNHVVNQAGAGGLKLWTGYADVIQIYSSNSSTTGPWTLQTATTYTPVTGTPGNPDTLLYVHAPVSARYWLMLHIRTEPGTIYSMGEVDFGTWAINPGSLAPVADFEYLEGQAGSSTAFTDLSTNTPTSWAWTFGDGGTSTSQNPSHVFATPGTYSVALTATNADGSDSQSHSIVIVAAGTEPPPEPAGVLLEIYAHAPGAARWDVAKWDEATWGEGGWRDVTPYGITVDIDWGSSRPELGILSTPDAASWSVDYYDPFRILDPANEEGPYFGDLIPFLPIRVSHRGIVVRQGYATGISHNYADPGVGYMRGADNITLLANAMVPSDTTLSNTLYARAVDAIAAAGLSVTVAAPVGTDPPVSPWVTAVRDGWSAWDWIKDAAQEVLQVPIIGRTGTLSFRPWAAPMARGRVLGSPELLDLGVVVDWSGNYSVVTARLDEDTIETRALTPSPRYGARTYARDEDTLNAGDWAATVLADRGLPTLLWKPGDMRPLTAVSTELLATIEAVELVTLSYPEADPPISASGIVVGGSIHIEGKRDDSAIWRFHYELAQTATEPLIETGGEDTDYLLRTGGGEYLYPTGSA